MIDLRPYRDRASIFLVWSDDETDDDAREVRAADAEEAAEDYAEWDDMNSAEYTILKGSEVTVNVCPKGGGETVRFVVSGEAVPQYTAREAT